MRVQTILWILSGTAIQTSSLFTPKIDPIDPTRRSILASPFSTAALVSSSLLSPLPSFATDQSTSVLLPGSKKPFPFASFGLQVYDDDTAFKLTTIALETGYRNFFASVLAGNQKGFAKAVKASSVPRSELYICGTVLSNRVQGQTGAYKKTAQGCKENMAAMSTGGIDHLDMIMLDYPGPDSDSIVGQWRAFEDFKKEGFVDDLAVSNFNANQLDVVLKMAEVKPCLNQLPYSLAYHPKGVLDYNRERGIPVQSWSPLSRVLTNPNYRVVLSSIGAKYGKSAAQVALRWIVQSGSGGGFSTQTKKRSHFEEDLKVFDFELTTEDMNQLTQMTA